jgi:hypothetical protein
MGRTESLNVVFVKATFDIFNHQTSLAYLGVSDHSYFDHDAIELN